MQSRYRLYGLVRDPTEIKKLRAIGVTPIIGDLDNPSTLRRLAGIAEWMLHTAPPPASGHHDQRTANLLNALGKSGMVPQRIVYISTSGVYGNCDGALVPETRRPNPQTARAVRRADAENQLRRWGNSHGVSTCILRAPGIYAIDRLPVERLKKAMPALTQEEDSYTNHIHADDLARIALIGLTRAKRGRIYNTVDDCPMKMGDYFDLVAAHCKLPRPSRVSRAEALATLPAISLSFMNESRRLTNTRICEELRIKLRYSSVCDALADR